MLALLALAGCQKETAAPPLMVPKVQVTAVKPEPVIVHNELPARTAAFLVSDVRPQVNGIIQKRLFTEGAEVEKGQVLYQIDPEPFQAALDHANAGLARARAGLKAISARVARYEELLPDNAVSRQDYDDANAAMQQAEADIKYYEAEVTTAAINLKYTRVTAPISGTIGKSSVTDGALVVAYQPLPLATIQHLNTVYVDAPQSTVELLRLREYRNDTQKAGAQSKVRLLLDDGSLYSLEGDLQFRDVSVDPTTGSVILRAIFPNPDGLLLPGMFVRMVVVAEIHEQAILVPQQSVMRTSKGEPYVFVVDENRQPHSRVLKLGPPIKDKWLVEEGLTPGELIIVEGIVRIRPNTPKVEVVNSGSEASPDDTPSDSTPN